PDAALHLLYPLLEMRVTGIDVAPGIDDADHRLDPVILSVETHLRCTGSVTERTHVLLSVPTVTSQIFRLPTGHGALPSSTVARLLRRRMSTKFLRGRNDSVPDGASRGGRRHSTIG